MNTAMDVPMEARLARLEARTHRLRAEIEALKATARFERKQRRLKRVYFGLYTVICVVVIAVLSAGFGWI